jgi:hypothetical protein
LVALGFIPNPDPENLPLVGHDDDCKDNNHWSNLYWTDSKENCGREAHVAQIRKKVYCVELDKVFNSVKEAAESLGKSPSNISSCLTGKLEKAYGYHWRYAEKI